MPHNRTAHKHIILCRRWQITRCGGCRAQGVGGSTPHCSSHHHHHHHLDRHLITIISFVSSQGGRGGWWCWWCVWTRQPPHQPAPPHDAHSLSPDTAAERTRGRGTAPCLSTPLPSALSNPLPPSPLSHPLMGAGKGRAGEGRVVQGYMMVKAGTSGGDWHRGTTELCACVRIRYGTTRYVWYTRATSKYSNSRARNKQQVLVLSPAAGRRAAGGGGGGGRGASQHHLSAHQSSCARASCTAYYS